MYPDDQTTVDVEPLPRRRSAWQPRPVTMAAAVVVVLLASVTLLMWPLVFRSAAATAGRGEVLLEPATAPGQDPFTSTVVVGNPTGTKVQTPIGATSGGIHVVRGDTPALYGGSTDSKLCDRAKLVEFLQGNPDKAAAWAGVLGIRTDDIAVYIGTLTPVLLRADTRVTNHGFRDGHATTLQSVLQAGTAVLVDDQGRPRVKCGCGNPLLDPVATPVSPVYTGSRWPGFNPAAVTAVAPASKQVSALVVYDVRNGATFARPPGTEGETDAPVSDPPPSYDQPPVGSQPDDPASTDSRAPGGPDTPTAASCPADTHADPSDGSCVPDAPVCPVGTHLDSSSCVDDPPSVITCSDGTHLEGGSCVDDPPSVVTCSDGTHLEGGSCVDDPPSVVTCSDGTHLEGGSCVDDPPSVVTCSDGTHLDGGSCVPDSDRGRQPCPDGTVPNPGSTCATASGRRRATPARRGVDRAGSRRRPPDPGSRGRSS